MHTRFNQVAAETDTITAVYLFYMARKTGISYDSLNKVLKMRNIPMKEVLESELVEKEGSQLLILTPSEGARIIESKRKLSAIDRAHYLYYLWKEGTIFKFERSAMTRKLCGLHSQSSKPSNISTKLRTTKLTKT